MQVVEGWVAQWDMRTGVTRTTEVTDHRLKHQPIKCVAYYMLDLSANLMIQ